MTGRRERPTGRRFEAMLPTIGVTDAMADEIEALLKARLRRDDGTTRAGVLRDLIQRGLREASLLEQAASAGVSPEEAELAVVEAQLAARSRLAKAKDPACGG